MVSPHLFKKKYYCKIDGKNYGPMNFEELKNLAMNKQLKSSDKVSLTFPSKDWLEASSMPELYEIFKAQADENDAFKFGGSTNTGATNFSQGVKLELLEKNSIEIVKLLRNIYGWMNFYFYAGMIAAFFTILAALVNNNGR